MTVTAVDARESSRKSFGQSKPWQKLAHGKIRRKPGTMNGTEAAYAEHLKRRQWAGEVLWYRYEGLTFRLADGSRYSPDFAVMLPSGLIELHEVKGNWFLDNAKTKVKVAAEMYPFRFVVVKRIAKKAGGGWSQQEF